MSPAKTSVSVGPAVAAASPPQAVEGVLALTRRLRMPYLRRAAAEVIPTALAQRWDPAEVLRVLLAEEITGRDDATVRMRRKRANFPAGRPSTHGMRPAALSPRPHPAGAADSGVGRPAREPLRLWAVWDRQVPPV